MPDVRWVRQEDAGGCGPATLAMIVGCTYAEAKQQIDRFLWLRHGEEEAKPQPVDWSDGGGMSGYHLDRALYEHGFYKQTRYASWGYDMTVPFASVHWAMVVQDSGNHHFVVMLANGDVLDPLREGVYRLSDWSKVNQVCGLARATAGMKQEAAA